MDLAAAQSKLALAEAAYEAALLGKSVASDGRSVVMEDVGRYRDEMAYWQRVVDGLQAAARGATPGIRVATWQ